MGPYVADWYVFKYLAPRVQIFASLSYSVGGGTLIGLLVLISKVTLR
jgi:hypothetical protein